jgi:CTP:molybdopterin cytidylyltransferase MocA
MQNTKHLLSLVRVADAPAVAAEVVEKVATAARTAVAVDVINQEKKNQCQIR